MGEYFEHEEFPGSDFDDRSTSIGNTNICDNFNWEYPKKQTKLVARSLDMFR
jgi:hypothetical protein